MKKLSDNLQILGAFAFWRILLFATAFCAVFLIKDFGGRFPYYQELLVNTNLPPWIWGFGNFDGVHYLNIAKSGYFAQYSQAFFPLYPLTIRFLNIFQNYFLSSIVISNTFYLISLFLMYKLFKLDYSGDTSVKAIILLLAFPTSFYFGAIYSESLFLLLVVGCLLLIRRKQFLLGGLVAALASSTRILGIFLFPVIIIEACFFYQSTENKSIGSLLKIIIACCLALLGLVIYMFYLKFNFNDPVYFLTAQPLFGAQRSSQSLIFLPQVFFRYLKMLLTVSPATLPFWNALLEFVFTIVPLGYLAWAFKKIRLSYWVFIFGCLILPTLTGTLSSMPRYSLMSFLLFPLIVKSMRKYIKLAILILAFLEVILTTLFIRGYWVA